MNTQEIANSKQNGDYNVYNVMQLMKMADCAEK